MAEVAAALVLFPATVAMGRRLPVLVFPVAAAPSSPIFFALFSLSL
jgi:hypothetical protein